MSFASSDSDYHCGTRKNRTMSFFALKIQFSNHFNLKNLSNTLETTINQPKNLKNVQKPEIKPS
jgi:hypothetical protein